MDRVKVEDFLIDTGFDFSIDDFKERLIDLIDRAFIEARYKGINWFELSNEERCFLIEETEEYRYFFINRAVYDMDNIIHVDFEVVERFDVEGLVELEELLHDFALKVYDIFLLEEKYKLREETIIYLEDK